MCSCYGKKVLKLKYSDRVRRKNNYVSEGFCFSSIEGSPLFQHYCDCVWLRHLCHRARAASKFRNLIANPDLLELHRAPRICEMHVLHE